MHLKRIYSLQASKIALNWMFLSAVLFAGRHIESQTRKVWGRVKINFRDGPLATTECILKLQMFSAHSCATGSR